MGNFEAQHPNEKNFEKDPDKAEEMAIREDGSEKNIDRAQEMAVAENAFRLLESNAKKENLPGLANMYSIQADTQGEAAGEKYDQKMEQIPAKLMEITSKAVEKLQEVQNEEASTGVKTGKENIFGTVLRSNYELMDHDKFNEFMTRLESLLGISSVPYYIETAEIQKEQYTTDIPRLAVIEQKTRGKIQDIDFSILTEEQWKNAEMMTKETEANLIRE